ncbi:MFS transporter [Candidatus Poribacteria bacterium]|nr:MFS transporter [Candidatus Poribacteria bacterium]
MEVNMRHLEVQYRSLYVGMLINFIIFGITLTIIGATLPKIIRDFEWSYTATGAVIAAGSIGYFVSTFVSGILLHTLNPKQVMFGGLLVQSLGLLFFASKPVILLNFFLNMLIGLGQGCTEVVVNYSVVRIEREGESRLMSLMHAAFAVGAVIGPFAVGRIIESGLSWQMIYRFMSAISLIMAVVFLTLPFSRIKKEEEDKDNSDPEKPGIIQLLKHPLLIFSFLILFIYVGTEMGTSAWVAEYYVKILGESASLGAYMVSVFWIGLLIGRLAFSGYNGTRQAEMMLLLSIICTVSLAIAIMLKNSWIAGLGFGFAGLGFSAIYPLVISVVGKYFKKVQGPAIGFTATGGGVGSFAFPFIMATISDHFGLRHGFVFYIALDVVMAILAGAVIWQVHKLEKTSKAKLNGG